MNTKDQKINYTTVKYGETFYGCHTALTPGSEVIKLFSCSTQLSMKISMLINMKMPTIVGIFKFISREIFMLSYAKQERIFKY